MRRPPSREILFELASAVYVAAVVIFFWPRPLVAFIGLALGLAGHQWFWRTRADVAVMIVAALLGTPSEMAAVHFGVWTYNAPGLVLGVPVWLPLVWAFLFCLFRRMSFTALTFIRPRPALNRWVHRIGGALVLAYGIAMILMVRRTIAAVYALTFLPSALFWRRERDVVLFIVAGILGTFGEYMCMKLGFWQYRYPILESIGLPVSLPLAWGLSGVIIARVATVWEGEGEE